MDSMKRNEANNSSHHQSKVVLMKKVADSKDERDLCKISVSEAISHEQNNSSRGSGSARCSSETILTAKSGSKNKSSHCNSDNVPVIGGRNNQLHKIPIPKAAASIVVFKSPTDPTTSQPEKNISDSRIGAISAPLAVVSDIKDSNFDDDNEWDVGIGDLIIDLDADIEKTGSNQLQQHQQQPNQLQQQAIEKALSKSIQTSEGAGGLQLPADEVLGCSGIRNATSTTKNTDNFLASGDDTGSSLTAELSLSEDGNIAPGSVAANTSSSNHCHNHQSDHHRNKHILLSGRREGDSSFKTTQQPVSNSPTTIALTATTVDCRAGDSDVSTESNLLQLVLTANQTDYQKQVPNANSGIEQHIFSIGNVRGKVGTSQPKTNNETTLGSNIITMSSTTSSSSSKSTTKLSVDHQATLDKGLKMKIKRTKPGTKTSEAKHEIVKSDQNGTTPTTATLTCSSGNSISGASSVLGNALSSHTTSTSGVTTTSSSTTQSSQSIVVANMNVNATTVAVTHSTKAADNTGMAAALNTSNNSTSNNSSNIISNIAVTNSSANLGTNVPYVVGLGGGAIVAGQSASCSNNANGNIGNPGTIGVSSNTGGNCNISTNSNSCVVGTTNSSGNNSKKHSSQSITNIASANTSISTVGVNNANQQQSMHCSSLHTSQQQAQLQTSNKRSSSSHRRDKGKDKATHHNQRDKSEQLSQQHQQQHQSEQQQQQPQQQQQQQQQKQQPQQQQQQQQPQQQQQQQPQQQQQQQQNQPEQQQDEQQEQQQPQPHPAQQQQQQQIQPQQQTQQQQQQSQQPQPQLPRSHQQPHHHHHNHSHQQHHSVSEDGASSGNSNHSSVISSSSCICSAYDGQVNGLLQQQQPPCSSTSCIYSKNMLGEDSGPNTDTTLIATQRLSKIGGGTGANNNTSVMNTVGSPSASSTVNSNNNTLSGSGQPLFVKDVCKMINAASSGIASQNTISPSVNSNMGITGGNSSYTANSTNSKVHLQNSLQQGIDDVSSNKANSTNMIVSSGMFLASVGTSASPGLHTQDGKMYGSSPPPAKRHKGDRKDMVDVCVGTSVGTITEPDCLGPCEPGTSVTLEGIVWHETEGGVLVVNVTWRGKTYVGTLIDCTKHDWAPPRFCDSPTEELDSRTPKGRGKRGRSSALLPSNDLSNFTETRSSMHSKLRNGGTKGRGGRGGVIEPNSTKLQAATAGSNALPSGNNASCAAIIGSNNTPSTSPIAFLPPRAEKRKSKDEPPSAHAAGYGSGTGFIAGGESLAVSSNATVGNNVISPTNASTGNSSDNVLNTGPNNGSCGDGMIASGTQYAIDGSVVGLNISVGGAAISVSKKSKVSTSPCAISPVLLECPEQDCSKKYKHANGLKYHQSHAHGGSASSMDEDSLQAPESPQPTKTPPPLPVTSESRGAVGPCSGPQSNLQTGDLLLNPETSALAVSSNSELVLALPATTTTAGDQNSSILTAVSSTASVSTVQSGTASSISTSSSQLSQQSIGSKSSQTMLATAAQVACNATPSLKDGENIAAHTIGGILLQPSHTSADQKGTKTNASELNDNIDSNGAIDTNMGMISLKDEVDVSAKLGIGGSNNRLSASVTTLLSGSNAGDATKAPSNYVKQKKMRKSPGPSEYDAVTTSASNRTEDVQSPAYSDISDDSSPVTDLTDMPVNSGEGSEKSKGSHVAETSATRKSNDGDDGVNGASNSNSSVGPLGQLAGYGLYPFYSGLPHQQPPTPGGSYFQSAPDLGSGRPPPPAPSATISTVVSHNIPTSIAVPATASSSGAIEYTKNKEPPLDLINKPGAGCSSQLSLHQQQMASSLSAPPTLTPGSTASSTDVTRGMPMNSPAMGIQHQGDIKDASILSAGPLSTPPGSKVLQHYYPYGYVASGYSYPGLDAGYGSLSVMTEESKHNSIGTVKEERFKESQGTSEYNKLTATPVMATKMSKSESLKDIKTESGLSVGAHQGSGVLTKEQSLTSLNSQPPPPPLPSQPLGPYGSMFQRHGLNTASPTGGPPPPPPSHMATRDEELRRLFSYSEQRRVSSGGSNGPPSGHPITTGLIPKEEPHSPSSHTPQSQQQQHSLHGQSMLAVNLPGGKSSKSSSSSLQSTSSTSVKGMGKSSDGTSIKLQQDEKESNVKVKQEGQKPTMETQGPPPPPTSQYYSPSLYMSAAPFGFDPNHQMYRQMLVSTAPYSASPYHLQIPRFNHPPEDLSRNQSTKALDLLQHHANQYYNSHKIHELGERALKSPTSSTVKVSVSNSNLSQQASCQTPNLCIPPPNNSSTGLSLQQQSVAVAQQQQISSSNSTSTGGGLGTSVVSSVGGGGGSSSGSGGSSGNSSSGGGGVGGAVGGGSGGSVSGGVPPALQQASSQQQPINTAGTHMQGSSLNNNGPGNSASGVNNGNGSTGISSGGGSGAKDCTHSVDHHGNTSGSNSQQQPSATSGQSMTGSGNSNVRSPPPQRHVHTHHHTHVGLGYPMFQAPYGAVLASPQATAVTVLSPFQTGPTAK